MRSWIKQFIPWLLVLSLGANLWLAKAIWDRDRYVNEVTWGNTVMTFSKYLHWSSQDTDQALGGEGLNLALEMSEQLQRLPHAHLRLDHQDQQVIWKFLIYAGNSAWRLEQEAQAGAVSVESAHRWEQVQAGLHSMARTAERQNQLKSSAYPWNHAQWRLMFHQMARDLQQLDLVPLE